MKNKYNNYYLLMKFLFLSLEDIKNLTVFEREYLINTIKEKL